jgi:predicted lipoprotein with Yx(FWY)xxD motif
MHRWFGLGSVLLLLMLSVASALAQEAIVKVTNNATLGNILTDSRGMTLYTFTKDTANVSNCYDKCAAAWPALMVSGGQSATGTVGGGKLGSIQRKDGSHQVTYNNMPLYYFAKDTKPGDTMGQNVGNVWFVVKVSAAASNDQTLPTTGASSPAMLSLLVLALGTLALGSGWRLVLARRRH